LKFGFHQRFLLLRHSLGLSSLDFCHLFKGAVVMLQEVCETAGTYLALLQITMFIFRRVYVHGPAHI
jgi:hypothetical protein